MEFVTRQINLKSGQTLRIIPLGCIHYGHIGHHEELYKECLKEGLKSNTYFIGLGDELDFARTSYRKALRAALPDEDSPAALDDFVARRMDDFIKLSQPIFNKEKCIGALEGNHHWIFTVTEAERCIFAGETNTTYMCRKQGFPYLGDAAYIQLKIHIDGKYEDELVILASHMYGQGGGGTVGADLNKMEKIEAGFDADVIIGSHSHKKCSYILPRIVYNKKQNSLDEKPCVLIKTGAFLRSYIPSRSTYAEKALMRPIDLGWVTLCISYDKKKTYLEKNIYTIVGNRKKLYYE